ncbi:MAG TPA: hypothetical protein VGB09_12300, partial [Candidatus Binatia bacterium]
MMAAVCNFSVGRIVIAAWITPLNGGMMGESFARPITSHTINQIRREKRSGIFLPNNVISLPHTYCF